MSDERVDRSRLPRRLKQVRRISAFTHNSLRFAAGQLSGVCWWIFSGHLQPARLFDLEQPRLPGGDLNAQDEPVAHAIDV